MNNQPVNSLVLETPAASPEAVHRHFMNKLSVETDVADVRYDMQHGVNDFLLIDVRSSKAYMECHIPGAINVPSNQISEETTAAFSKDQVIVVYCWGPACNGGTKGAARLSGLGFRVKEMLGGIEYWRKEGNEVEGTLGQAAPLIG
ncbi:rhodanese-like domain-containing protein [Paenibacillus chondroitinus]|uniref:Rhodanese-like domain-containing protein n=1 Tax=Paenibacillus chondroitinus TaxID=59842 RepID=A0ABU6DP02_9BACL|nr:MULTISPECIES: rhodanese-like domain-containing protein [Paenibacillus]MCY9662431.1 rhodanese-like domain-containing protein [Paenibacillus anseongense]MEB4798576.1 rhodanese-like domain-containing protein [Paenibacillus chondroitinus]